MANDFTKAPSYKQEIYYLYYEKLKKLEDYYTQIKNNADDIDFYYDDIYDKVYTILSESPSAENYKKAEGMIFIHHHLYSGKRKTLSYTDKEANIDFTMTLFADEIKISFKLPIFAEFMNNVNVAIQNIGNIDTPQTAYMCYGFDNADGGTYKYLNFDKMLIEELCKRFSATVITDIIKKLFAK